MTQIKVGLSSTLYALERTVYSISNQQPHIAVRPRGGSARHICP